MKRILLFIAFSVYCSSALAINSGACTSVAYGRGWFRKYPGLGIGETGMNNMTKTTSKGSTIKGTSDVTSQSSTASTDPGVSTGFSQSQSQSTSFWGPCSLLASDQEMRKLRELYYVQNKDMFLKALAQGHGEHLEVMSFFARCPQSEQLKFNAVLQSKYPQLIEHVAQDNTFLDALDALMSKELNCQLNTKV